MMRYFYVVMLSVGLVCCQDPKENEPAPNAQQDMVADLPTDISPDLEDISNNQQPHDMNTQPIDMSVDSEMDIKDASNELDSEALLKCQQTLKDNETCPSKNPNVRCCPIGMFDSCEEEFDGGSTFQREDGSFMSCQKPVDGSPSGNMAQDENGCFYWVQDGPGCF